METQSLKVKNKHEDLYLGKIKITLPRVPMSLLVQGFAWFEQAAVRSNLEDSLVSSVIYQTFLHIKVLWLIMYMIIK